MGFRIGLALAALVAFAASAASDVLLPGTRPVRHELVLEPSPHFAEHDFVAAPVRGFGGITRIEPGVPFTFSSKYGTRLFAIEPGAECPEGYESPEGPAVARIARAVGAIPLAQVASVPVTSTLESITTRLRIASIADGRIELAVVDTETERDLGERIWLVLVPGLGLAGLLWLWLRRRRKAA